MAFRLRTYDAPTLNVGLVVLWFSGGGGGGGGGGVLDPCPSGSAHTEQYETLVLHVFSLRYARARYILRIKPDDVLGNPGVTHQSSQWVRNAVGTERVTTHASVNEDDSMSYSWFKRVQALKMNKI